MTMENIYFSTSHPAGFGGQNILFDAVKPSKTLKDIKSYLKNNNTYRKFRIPTKFERARIFVTSLGHMFQCDLFDMQHLSRSNKGFRYILLVCDCFSRKIWAEPLKQKSAKHVSEAMRQIFVTIQKEGLLAPRALLGSDLGLEFWNSEVAEVLKAFNITLFALRAPTKAAIAEISGRWLKDKIYKYFHAESTKNWISELNNFVHAKNTRKSRSLGGLAPVEINFDNQAFVFDQLYPVKMNRQKPLDIGQKVQIAVERMTFAKSYHGYFSDKIYEIKRIHDHRGIFRYTLIDTTDDAEICGTYYGGELLPI